MIFGLTTVCVLAFSWSACSEKTPAPAVVDVDELLQPTGDNPLEKMTSLMEKYWGYMKGKHIKTEEDIQELADVTNKFKEIYEELEEEGDEWSNSLTEEDAEKLMGKLSKIVKKVERLEKRAKKEADRLREEAEENGLDLDDYGYLFDFDDEDLDDTDGDEE